MACMGLRCTDRMTQNTHPVFQVWWIFVRTLLQNYRQWSTSQSDLALSMAAGIVVGLIYRNPTELQVTSIVYNHVF